MDPKSKSKQLALLLNIFSKRCHPLNFLDKSCLNQRKYRVDIRLLIEKFRKAFITMAFILIVVLSPLFKTFKKSELYYPVKFNAL